MQREAPYPELLTFHADASHSERVYGNVPKKMDREWSTESARILKRLPICTHDTALAPVLAVSELVSYTSLTALR